MKRIRLYSTALTALAAAVCVTGGLAHAAVIVTTTRNVAPDGGAVHQTYDPAVDVSGSGPVMTASSTDLAQGLAATYDGDAVYEFSTGVSAWTNGSLATVYNESGPAGDVTDHAAYGSVTNNTNATFDLGGLANISKVDVYAGWNDSGRDDFGFDLQVSVDGVSYSTLANFPDPANDTGQITVPITTLHSITDDGAADIATGVRYVRLHINGADNGAAGIVEVDVFGARVPEPSTFGLAGLALLACAKLRRRS
ncbi:MAG: PEP-CTERM sorting domain-containing protein [Planctomycetales bacterium]|nr:PEP-CTERM sorting domain-containing protein [Planctomycetales bacterium]